LAGQLFISLPLYLIFWKRGKTFGDGQLKTDLANGGYRNFLPISHMSCKYPILMIKLYFKNKEEG
jgi:hypothetical protein